MSWVVGIDGCRGGWIAAGQAVQGGEVRAVVEKRLKDILVEYPGFRFVCVDTPLGLTESGSRRCDELIRSELSERASSVFPAINRPLIQCRSKKEFWRKAKSLDNCRPSIMSPTLLPRTRELDELLDDELLRRKVWEVHPEWSFRKMNESSLSFSKKDQCGIKERRLLLHRAFGFDVAADVAFQVSGSRAEPDDILDSLAALWTCWRLAKHECVFLPPEPFPVDRCGRRMVIAG